MNRDEVQAFRKRFEEAIAIVRVALQYASRDELEAWQFQPELIEAILAYRQARRS